MLTWSACLKRCILVKIILKNLTQRKKLSLRLPVTHCLQTVHLIHQKNKLDFYSDKDCMKRFCKGLKDHTMKMINFEEIEMIPLTG